MSCVVQDPDDAESLAQSQTSGNSAGAHGVRDYGRLFWCPRFDEFREQNWIGIVVGIPQIGAEVIERGISWPKRRESEYGRWLMSATDGEPYRLEPLNAGKR